MEVINCDKFCDSLFKGLSFTRQISIFFIGNWRRRYNSAAQPVIYESHRASEVLVYIWRDVESQWKWFLSFSRANKT